MTVNHQDTPSVLVIGRPNVGKSSFINRLLKKRRAITEDLPGVTRDVIPHDAVWKGRPFTLLDSAGLFLTKSSDSLQLKSEAIVLAALKRATNILFIVDYNVGLQESDRHIARLLRPVQDKVILAVNKVDAGESADTVSLYEFLKLGFGDPFPISCTQGSGFDALMKTITSSFEKFTPLDLRPYKIALIGRPNVGKSSLLNSIFQDEKVVVDATAGTTRDVVEHPFDYKGTSFIFADTAGIRRKSKFASGTEYFSMLRSKGAIQDADIVIIVLDATEFFTDQDKKLISEVLASYKNLLLFVNKWDALEPGTDPNGFLLAIEHEFTQLLHFPILFGSALNRLNITDVLDRLSIIMTNSQKRLPTAIFNQFLSEVVKRANFRRKGKLIRFSYGTQSQVSPPEFVFFTNYPDLITPDISRFLESKLREYFDEFEGVPIKFVFRSKN